MLTSVNNQWNLTFRALVNIVLLWVKYTATLLWLYNVIKRKNPYGFSLAMAIPKKKKIILEVIYSS